MCQPLCCHCSEVAPSTHCTGQTGTPPRPNPASLVSCSFSITRMPLCKEERRICRRKGIGRRLMLTDPGSDLPYSGTPLPLSVWASAMSRRQRVPIQRKCCRQILTHRRGARTTDMLLALWSMAILHTSLIAPAAHPPLVTFFIFLS